MRSKFICLPALLCVSVWSAEIRLGDAPRVTAPLEGVAGRAGVAARSLSVDTTSRAAVAAFFNTNYTAAPAIGWTGSDVTPYDPGTISSAFQDATLFRVNFYRAMAGLPATVVFDASLNAECQQGALMMSVAGTLDHSPPSSPNATWPYATANGADAAGHSNLSLGTVGPDAMDGLMADPGANNTFAGHRRWILYPPQQTMGHGAVPGSGTLFGADALWVIAMFGTRPPTPTNVPWPNAGYFPYQLLPWDYDTQTFAKIPGRWTFSMNGADFSAATVTMTSGGNNVNVQLETVTNGYGDNTLVWKALGVPLTAPGADTTYAVTVSNVKVNNAAQTFNYSVIVFDPSGAGNGPAANGQSVSTVENTALPITLTGLNGNTFALASQPAHGALSGFNASSGAVTYTPTDGYSGSDSFTFTITDGVTVSPAATVNITVLGSGDAYPQDLLTYLAANNIPVNATAQTTSAMQSKTTLSIRLNFSAKMTSADSSSFVTPVSLPAAFTVTARQVVVDIGGVIRQYALDDKGRATGDKTSTLTLAAKLKNGATTVAGLAKCTVKLSKSDLHTTLAASGLKDDQTYTKQQIPLPVTLVIVDAAASTVVHGILTVIYSAKPAKTGTAKGAL